jgi:hypothetical protein
LPKLFEAAGDARAVAAAAEALALTCGVPALRRRVLYAGGVPLLVRLAKEHLTAAFIVMDSLSQVQPESVTDAIMQARVRLVAGLQAVDRAIIYSQRASRQR